MQPIVPAAFQVYLTNPPLDSALARAIAFGIDPTLTFFNRYGLVGESPIHPGTRRSAPPSIAAGIASNRR